jgi:tetratricopeptide (TPR) repeat protein
MLVGWNGVAAAEWAAAAAKLAGGDPLLAARADLMSEEARAVKGELAPARESLATMVERCRRNGQLPLAARALAACARCDLHLRHFADAREGFEQALRLDRAMGSWADLASDLAGLGQGFLWDGRPQEARRPLEQALRCAQDQADSLVAAEASVHLGVCVALTSDPAEGLQLTLSGARLAAQVGAREAQLAADLHLLRIARIRSDAKAIAAMLGRCLDERRELRTPLLLGVLEELDPSGSPT